MRPPLDIMRIRTAELDKRVNTQGVTARLTSAIGGDFGHVRNPSVENPAGIHQGWDLYADVGTPIYAVSSGVVEHFVFVAGHQGFGRQLCLLLKGDEIEAIARRLGAKHLYAFYGHLLSSFVEKGYEAKQGDRLGVTGHSGNAFNTPPHLHFEIRRHPHLERGTGLHGRINPGEVLGFQYYQCCA